MDTTSIGTQDLLPEENIELHREFSEHRPRTPKAAAAAPIDDGLFFPVAGIAVATFGTMLYREHTRLMSDQRVQEQQEREYMQQTLLKIRGRVKQLQNPR